MAKRVAIEVRPANLPYDRLIYDLISANNLYGIRSLLNPLTLRHRQSIACQTVYKKTLLGYACELGCGDIVKYLVDECEAGITERFSLGQKSLTPLSVSICNINVSIILLLISRGIVAVDRRQARDCTVYAWSKRYFTLSSILNVCTNRIKTLDGILEGPNVFTCAARMHYSNIDGFSDFDTILVASARGDIARIKNLISDDMDLKVTNDSEDNALCMAILHEQSNAEHFLLNYRVFSIKDHVLALELCGAKFIIFLSDFDNGLRCWRKAIRIRTEEYFGVSDKLGNEAETDLGIEFLCEEELDKLTNYSAELYIQALLVCVRLLSPLGEVLKNAFVVVARQYAFHNDLLRVIKVLGELSEFPCIPITALVTPYETSAITLKSLFSSHFHSDASNMDDFLWRFRYLMDFINWVDWKVLFSSGYEFYLLVYVDILILVLGYIVAMQRFYLCANDEAWIKDGISRILKLHSEPYPSTLLHMSIEDPTAPTLIPFLLGCSADANCTDKDKNTPMHELSFLAEDDPYSIHLLDLLADAGGHVDSVNLYDMSPIVMFTESGAITNPLKYLTLQCLAAQTIHEYDIKVPESYPKILASFIKLHSF